MSDSDQTEIIHLVAGNTTPVLPFTALIHPLFLIKIVCLPGVVLLIMADKDGSHYVLQTTCGQLDGWAAGTKGQEGLPASQPGHV